MVGSSLAQTYEPTVPGAWRGRQQFVALASAFEFGRHFLSMWAKWRGDAGRCGHLFVISFASNGLTRDALAAGLAEAVMRPEMEGRGELVVRLLAACPPLTPGWHHLDFDEFGGRVTLQLGVGDRADLVGSLLASVDRFDVGLECALNRSPKGELFPLASRMAKLAAPGAIARVGVPDRDESVATLIEAQLRRAGFVPFNEGGGEPHRLHARFEPRHVPPPQAGGLWPALPIDRRHALVLGAGLAGCSAAMALCQAGWRVTLLDQAAGPAQGASGNPGGLFHSILHGEDGIHSRAHRAAAMACWQLASPWIKEGLIKGQCDGLMRLDATLNERATRAQLSRQGLSADHVQLLSDGQASLRSGMALPSGGWFFGQGGWVSPADYAREMLRQAAMPGLLNPTTFHAIWNRVVASIRRSPTHQAQDVGGCSGEPCGGLWQAIDEAGEVVAQAPVLVLANAALADALLSGLPEALAVSRPPMSAMRGQLTCVGGLRGHLPRLPVAGNGYVLALDDDTLLCGATSSHPDDEPGLRELDQRHNIEQAERLGVPCPLDAPLRGRVGWRATTPDRLPLVGALPWSAERLDAVPRLRREQVRQLPRSRDGLGGLYILSGLGSRGITWAALAGRLLAHWVAGTPCPIEADLRDALDPARFVAREAAKRA
jgi:tRNA 5-methylaminomethyl-2-thiouridine biosynthesis bifunctional protein